MSTLQGTRFGDDAVLSLVRLEDRKVAYRVSLSEPMPSLQARCQIGLAVLPVVLRRRDQRFNRHALRRQSLRETVQEPRLYGQVADAVHALLPVVPEEG